MSLSQPSFAFHLRVLFYCYQIELTITTFYVFRELDEGDSGSIVYFVGEKLDGRHRRFPWGMLVEKEWQPRGAGEQGYEVYHAVVLDQIFQDIAADHRDKFTKLTPFSVPR